jgi:hypothetical protein
MSAIVSLGDQAFISPAGSTSTVRVQASSSPVDQVQISTLPLTAQIEQLQREDPPNFRAVVGDAIRQLRAAAWQSTNQVEAAYLSGLADRFQRLAETSISESPADATQSEGASVATLSTSAGG